MESVTWAGLNSDPLPLEVTLEVKLGRNKRGAALTMPHRYDCIGLPDTVQEGLGRYMLGSVEQVNGPMPWRMPGWH